MNTSNIKRSVKAGSVHEAFKVAKAAARKEGYTVLGASNPAEATPGNWEVEVMIEGEEKKTLKSVFKSKPKPVEALAVENED
jgi:hypothetical protein